MSVKEKVNKSAEIRKLHASGVKSASEIVSKLKTQNIKVTPALVYNVLAAKKNKNKSKKMAASHSSGRETIVDHAVVFVTAAGGMQSARELLSKLALLRD
jgi:arginine repressor